MHARFARSGFHACHTNICDDPFSRQFSINNILLIDDYVIKALLGGKIRMATGPSTSCSPEKVSLTSSPSSSTLGSALDAICARSSPHGSQQDLSLHPGKCLAYIERSVRASSRRTNSDSSCISLSVGGLEEGMTLNFNPREPVHKWKKLSSCEEFVGTKRSKHTIVSWNDRIYVFGGDNGRRMLNDFLVSHIHDFSWARVVYTGELGGNVIC